jgi:hypothetical protein
MTYHVIIQPQAEAEIEAAYLWKREALLHESPGRSSGPWNLTLR